MKKQYLAVLLSTAAAVHAGAAEAPDFTDVFMAGEHGYASIRIPALMMTSTGTLLAFAEGRMRPSDQAENDIVLKRSFDQGRTWSPLEVLHDDGAHSLNNPTVVQDRTTGRIFLWYQRIPSHLKERSPDTPAGLEGPNIYRNFLLTSDDEGKTWSAPRDVTADTKRPVQATTLASGPGTGIQLSRGPHRGRLLIPFNQGPYGQWQNYAVYSDDTGQSWTYGSDVPGAMVPDGKGGQQSQINEVQFVEMNDGRVRLSSRQFAGNALRRTAISGDGGQTWSAVVEMPGLRDPGCMASILRFSFDDPDGHGRLLHSGPDSAGRTNGTIYLSTDDGETWPVRRVLYPGSFAYSVLVRLHEESAGCLFEADKYHRIVMARFSMDWLTAGKELPAEK